jgi:AraC-like DNA-binding protein
MEDAGSETNSCTFVLETSGSRSTFQERRITDGKVYPAHNDGYTIAYLLDVLRGAMGPSWEGHQVVARVCEPEAVPDNYLGIRTAKTDTLGASIAFPSRWLLHSMNYLDNAEMNSEESRNSLPASNVVDALRSAITPHLHEFNLNAERAAEICGINKRTLARRLKRRGTSVSREINSMRHKRASRLLADTNKSVGVVAQDVGYADPAVFTRAFRRWSGMTPSRYRSTQRAVLDTEAEV